MHKGKPSDPNDLGANFREFAEAVGKLGEDVARNNEAAMAEIDRRRKADREYRESIESVDTVEVEKGD